MPEQNKANGRKFYNHEALAAAIGDSRNEILAVAVKADVHPNTVRKAMSGDPSVVLNTLMGIVEAAGVEYGEVFDPVYYKANRPKRKARN